jgi:hypothetical protein
MPTSLLLVSTLCAAVLEGPVHDLAEDLGGPPSPYAGLVVELARRTVAPAPLEPDTTLRLTCLSTPGAPRYVGAVQEQLIHAPLDAVRRVIDDVPHYKDLFPGCVGVRVVEGSRDGNRFVTAWEQAVPVFFLPSTRYELTYLVSSVGPGRVVYRYRLARDGDLSNSDGVLVLEASGPGETRFTEYDFYDAHWGPLPTGLVWSESLRGMFLSDVAVKLRAENPDWSYERVATEARAVLDRERGSIARCQANRRDAASLVAVAAVTATPPPPP